MNKFAMIIFGASGDLTKRKLIPALYTLYTKERLDNDFAIICTARTEIDDEGFRKYVSEQMDVFISAEERDEKKFNAFLSHFYYHVLDLTIAEHYDSLRKKIIDVLGEEKPDNLLYYLAIPPAYYGEVPVHLKEARLNTPHSRIIVEKPFGHDLQSAIELGNVYKSIFEEHQIFRIDHYLGKETAQNILALRFANGIFEPVWNRNYIDYIEVTAVENLGIENRGGYYDHSGALRDMVQNHLIQLLALAAMEPPAVFNADSFRNEVVKVYESIRPLSETDLKEHIIRGQYTASGDKKGYREEKQIKPNSRTETYVAMRLNIDNWRWSGVPFYIRTGKQMPTKVTEIVIHFKETPHQMFNNVSEGKRPQANQLTLRIQPNEGISLKVGLKAPGSSFDVKRVAMDFTYDELGNLPVNNAYARLIDDCIQGDPTLFTRNDATEASWRLFDPVLKYWENSNVPLYGYPAGTWGPKESDMLMHDHHADWTNPCKNLTHTDLYCEL